MHYSYVVAIVLAWRSVSGSADRLQASSERADRVRPEDVECLNKFLDTVRDPDFASQLERSLNVAGADDVLQRFVEQDLPASIDPRMFALLEKIPGFRQKAKQIAGSVVKMLREPQFWNKVEEILFASGFLEQTKLGVDHNREDVSAAEVHGEVLAKPQSLIQSEASAVERSAETLRPLRSLAVLLLALSPSDAFVHITKTAAVRQTIARSPEQHFRMNAPSSRLLVGPTHAGSALMAAPHSSSGNEESSAPDELGVAGALASSAVLLEAIQLGGTAAALAAAQNWLGTENPLETVAQLIDYVRGLGNAGYPVFASALIFLQVVPIASGFGLTFAAGAIFGAVKGTATVVTCSTLSATISFLISRNLGREFLLESVQDSKQFLAIDKAFREATFPDALTLITLLRLSPVVPFALSNYVLGLAPVGPLAFSLGTALGQLIPTSAYVSAGQAGAEVALNGVGQDPVVLALGVAATLGGISFAGKTATNALKDLDLDLEEEE